jgi:hypothetical protein
MRRVFAVALLSAIGLAESAWAVDKEKAQFVGGTVSSVPPGTDGMLGTSDPQKLLFIAEKGGGVVEVPYQKVTDIEYGQKVGRRWKSAILLSPVAIFMKGRKHFVTITYKDQADQDQAAIFEVGKNAIRTTLTILETRAGRKVSYQDAEAGKARGN